MNDHDFRKIESEVSVFMCIATHAGLGVSNRTTGFASQLVFVLVQEGLPVGLKNKAGGQGLEHAFVALADLGAQ